MTLPDERWNALVAARHLLLALMIPKETPRVPREIRRWARAVLKHYPHEVELNILTNHPLLRTDKRIPPR
jgi:hypothetical protein